MSYEFPSRDHHQHPASIPPTLGFSLPLPLSSPSLSPNRYGTERKDTSSSGVASLSPSPPTPFLTPTVPSAKKPLQRESPPLPLTLPFPSPSPSPRPPRPLALPVPSPFPSPPIPIIIPTPRYRAQRNLSHETPSPLQPLPFLNPDSLRD
ncbi:myb-related transcription factor, partner of profilin-like [Macrobrachium rosenbergii]|uniref:myb-related transcription factor, partner of profilin-like n=1 Tax=Macrobrachium rosenbergii TaxID=79674 RepID=UPI0034D3B62D